MMVAWGEEDRILPVEHVAEAAELYPNAVVHRLRGVGHMPQIEAAGAFNALAGGLLAGSERAPREP